MSVRMQRTMGSARAAGGAQHVLGGFEASGLAIGVLALRSPARLIQREAHRPTKRPSRQPTQPHIIQV